jgi:hypothetical protein
LRVELVADKVAQVVEAALAACLLELLVFQQALNIQSPLGAVEVAVLLVPLRAVMVVIAQPLRLLLLAVAVEALAHQDTVMEIQVARAAEDEALTAQGV